MIGTGLLLAGDRADYHRRQITQWRSSAWAVADTANDIGDAIINGAKAAGDFVGGLF